MYNDLKLFNELAEKCGNRYLAARYLASVARNYGKQAQGAIAESKLITWALTGQCPYDEEELDRRKFYDSDVAAIEDYLCYIDDREIASQVRKYYIMSLRNRHITLDSSDTFDKYRQMRVNIILRMMWYGFEGTREEEMAKIKLEELKWAEPEVQEIETINEVESEVEEVIETSVESEVESEVEEVTETEEPVRKFPYIVKVDKLKIYSAPTISSVARTHTGNVEVIGEIDKFGIVKYVRPGFGTVRGYTIGLDF